MFEYLAQLGLPIGGNINDPRTAQLMKALGTSYERQNQTQFQAMVPEDLRATMISTTLNEKQMPLWSDIDKVPAHAVVHEFTTWDAVGADFWGGGFFSGGDLPMTNDPTVARRFATVKFSGDVREITHQARIAPDIQVGPNNVPADLVAKQEHAGTIQILRNLERSMMFGRSDVNVVSMDGIEIQLTAANPVVPVAGNAHSKLIAGTDQVIDMRNVNLADKDLNLGAQRIREGFGVADKLYVPVTVLTNLASFLAADRRMEQMSILGQSTAGIKFGYRPRAFNSTFGDIEFRDGVLTDTAQRVVGTSAIGSSPPVAPTDGAVPTASPVAGAGEVTKFLAGDYAYSVTAFNPEGESAPLDLGTVTVAAGDVVKLQVDHGGGAWSVAKKDGVTGYRVYRTKKDDAGGVKYWIDDFAYVDGNDDTYTDMDLFMPGTSRAFMAEMNGNRTLSCAIYAALRKYPLPVTGTIERFLMLHYSTGAVVTAPRRIVEYINIGPFVP